MTDDFVDRNATTIDATDASNSYRLDGTETQRERYNRLSLANRLDSNGKWMDREKQTKQDSRAIIDAVASQLELTSLQRERAHQFFSSLPESFNTAYSTALLALCVCGISGREDGRSYHPNLYHPNADNPSAFTEIAVSINVSYGELYSCWLRVKEET